MDKKIAVAVSGGVDSGVALLLLKEQGYDLVAVFTEHFSCLDSGQTSSCCSLDSLRRARQTSESLDVPFYKMDFREDFKNLVVEPLISYYKKGLTPNPCVLCNSKIRFGTLMKKLRSIGVDYLATGHYANLDSGILTKGKDSTKDQSYFLYSIDPKILENIMFPLGKYKKTDIIQIAHDNNLAVRDARESQDCCVFMEDSLEEYLKTKIELKEGDIVNSSGKVLGKHRGFQIYTLGQRRGLGGLGEKMYVCALDPEKNRVVVGPEEMLYKNSISFNISTPSNFFVESGEHLEVKLRSTQKQVQCKIVSIDNLKQTCTIEFLEAQRSPTPGQSAVLYREDRVVGGGEILL